MNVGPNSVTTGRPKATPKNRGPLSVVTSSRLRRTQALVRPRLTGSSARLTTFGCRAVRTICSAVRRSSGPQTTSTLIRSRSAIRRASSPKYSDGHSLAAPNAPLELSTTTCSPGGQAELLPHGVGRRFVAGQSLQVQPRRLARRAEGIGQLQIAVDRRRRNPPAAATRRMQLGGQRHARVRSARNRSRSRAPVAQAINPVRSELVSSTIASGLAARSCLTTDQLPQLGVARMRIEQDLFVQSCRLPPALRRCADAAPPSTGRARRPAPQGAAWAWPSRHRRPNSAERPQGSSVGFPIAAGRGAAGGCRGRSGVYRLARNRHRRIFTSRTGRNRPIPGLDSRPWGQVPPAPRSLRAWAVASIAAGQWRDRKRRDRQHQEQREAAHQFQTRLLPEPL